MILYNHVLHCFFLKFHPLLQQEWNEQNAQPLQGHDSLCKLKHTLSPKYYPHIGNINTKVFVYISRWSQMYLPFAELKHRRNAWLSPAAFAFKNPECGEEKKVGSCRAMIPRFQGWKEMYIYDAVVSCILIEVRCKISSGSWTCNVCTFLCQWYVVFLRLWFSHEKWKRSNKLLDGLLQYPSTGEVLN